MKHVAIRSQASRSMNRVFLISLPLTLLVLALASFTDVSAPGSILETLIQSSEQAAPSATMTGYYSIVTQLTTLPKHGPMISLPVPSLFSINPQRLGAVRLLHAVFNLRPSLSNFDAAHLVRVLTRECKLYGFDPMLALAIATVESNV